MMLTLFTDASLCGHTKAAGWGAWFKRKDMQQGALLGGEIACAVTSSGDAEIHAIAQALDTLARRGWLHAPVEAVLLQSDSVRALQLILQCVPHTRESQHQQSKISSIATKQRLSASPIERGALFVIQDVLRRQSTIVRHVKGHQQGNGRSWVNRQCDAIAREHMQAARAKREGRASA